MRLNSLCFSIVIMLGGICFAQESSCPVQITEVRNIEQSMFISFRNTTSRDIKSYEFDISFVDVFGKPHIFPFPLLRNERIAAGTTRVAAFPSADTLEFLFPVLDASLFKVTFADGSTWNDNGSRECSLSALQE
jgi:hypothetical protein